MLDSEKIDEVLGWRKQFTVVHHIPGRLRLRCKNRLLLSAAKPKLGNLEDLVVSVAALKDIKFNFATGSVTILYDPDMVNFSKLEAFFSEDDHKAREACTSIAEIHQAKEESGVE